MSPKAKTQTPEMVARYGHIAILLRNELKRRDLSVAQLNRMLGMSGASTTIYTWLRGGGAPSPVMRAKLAKTFSMHESVFMARALTGPGGAVQTIEAFPASEDGAAPVEITRAPPQRHDVLSFTVTSDGQARIRLDATLPLDQAAPLFRILLDAGLVLSQEAAG